MQILQCLERLVLITSQSGQRSTGSKFYNRVKNDREGGFLRYPGSENELIIKNSNVNPNRAVLTMNHTIESKSKKNITKKDILTWKNHK